MDIVLPNDYFCENLTFRNEYNSRSVDMNKSNIEIRQKS